jgi:hypothetical protein
MTLPSLSFIVWSGSRFLGVFVGAFSPISTSRRMASGRLGCSFCFSIQRSTSANGPGVNVKWIDVAFVAGRPRVLFSVREIDFAIFNLYRKSKPRGRYELPPRL